MQTRDHTKLICDIHELTGLFADTTSLEACLQKIVVMISEHMQTDVCSIYLFYEDTEELVLTATKGLHPRSIGTVKMKLGEGLTGLALKELRPICEKNASRNSYFKYFPGIGEEKYESFLAVPIVRGNRRIGAMVIQNTKKDYFTDEDVRVLRAITSQLANTIETTKLLMTIREGDGKKAEPLGKERLKFLKGKIGSSGLALGEAAVMGASHLDELLSREKKNSAYSLEDFKRALHTSEEELKKLQADIEKNLSDVASLIFTAQRLMLKDKAFVDSILSLMDKGVNPAQAILETVKKYIAAFETMTNSYWREKSHDVEDVGRRLLKNLVGFEEADVDYQNRIIVARELFPSDIFKLFSQKIKGIVLLSGGVSSHLSILARSLNIPLVIVDEPELLHLSAGTPLILDADAGNVYINPTEKITAPFREREQALQQISKTPKSQGPTLTKDGVRILLLSNINLLGDLKIARALHSEGVGLYRSEFPFLVRSNFPSEEEQFVIYQKLIEGMPGKEVTFRTLDIGGDKVLSYYTFEKEENPFLGMRSIRFSLAHKDIFAQQIRAILKAGAGVDLKIMFPMISSVDEYLEARDVVLSCLRDLKKEKAIFHDKPKLGAMIELPSVLEIIEALTEETDFLSIGTNDFVQYLLAVDRTNEKVADLYLAHHPSVLRALKKIAQTAQHFNKELSICGDMAQDEKYLPFLLGIGISRFSVDSRYLPRVRAAIQGIQFAEARKKANLLLTKATLRDIEKILA